MNFAKKRFVDSARSVFLVSRLLITNFESFSVYLSVSIVTNERRILAFILSSNLILFLVEPLRWRNGLSGALQFVDLGIISPGRVKSKDFKNWYDQLPCMALSTKEIVWRTSRQACLLCLWARHLTRCFHLYQAERWWGQALYPSWAPSLTEDSQAA